MQLICHKINLHEFSVQTILFNEREIKMRPIRTPQNNPQSVTVGAASTASVAFGASTNYIRVVATVDTYVAIGATPVATAASIYLVAKVPEFFGVSPGQKIAALEVASGGILSVVEGNALS
jgi:hypothetical protein